MRHYLLSCMYLMTLGSTTGIHFDIHRKVNRREEAKSDTLPYPLTSSLPGSCDSLCGTLDEDGNLTFRAPTGKVLDQVVFASYGTPTGTCGSYALSSCNNPNSTRVVQQACSGKVECAIPVVNSEFGKDPCYLTRKRLSVEICYVPIIPTGLPSSIPTVLMMPTVVPTLSVTAPVGTCPSLCKSIGEDGNLTISAPPG